MNSDDVVQKIDALSRELEANPYVVSFSYQVIVKGNAFNSSWERTESWDKAYSEYLKGGNYGIVRKKKNNRQHKGSEGTATATT